MAAITASAMLFASFSAAIAAADELKVENEPSYTDVKNGDNYFDAIELLSALNIMDGYEDGSFKPNQKLTRAEFVKIIIMSMDEYDIKVAEESMGTETIFSDVPGDHWASGYIGVATSITEKGIINGMGDGTFKPEANITYAQAMKILTCMLGYSQWAEDVGAWPDGYMYWANQLKIGKGISGVSSDAEITRGQAARMIKNAIIAPIVVDTRQFTYDAYGNRFAMLEQKGGTGEDFRSLLIDKHDIYQVEGYMDGDDAFVITSAVNFAGKDYTDSKERIDIDTQYKRANSGITATAFIRSVDGENTLLYMY